MSEQDKANRAFEYQFGSETYNRTRRQNSMSCNDFSNPHAIPPARFSETLTELLNCDPENHSRPEDPVNQQIDSRHQRAEEQIKRKRKELAADPNVPEIEVTFDKDLEIHIKKEESKAKLSPEIFNYELYVSSWNSITGQSFYTVKIPTEAEALADTHENAKETTGKKRRKVTAKTQNK
ncbi:MAG: hypothetical protein FWF97_00395 [Alphaproteobacteria bacterium]|nr:hypothetical protein [Alphaproteobacteria bacterium]